MINLLCISSDLDIITYNMLGSLKSRGYNIFITYSTKNEHQKIEEIGCKGVKIFPLKGKLNIKNILLINKIIKKYQIQINYCLTSTGIANATLASAFRKIKTIAYRGTQAKIRPTDPTYYLGILNPKLNTVVCETRDIKAQLTKYYSNNKLIVNPKPYKTDWVKNAILNPKELNGIPKDAFVVICIAKTKGRPHKGLTELIKGVHLLKNKTIHLLHIGDYDESNYELAKQGNNADQIHFAGFKHDAIHYLPKSDVCICPSTRDAAPLAIKEAMACGKPSIVTDIPGARELVVHQKTGLTIPPNSPEAIAKAIEYLASQPHKTEAFGKAAKEHLEKTFCMKNYLEKFDLVFK
ncbi:MAG: glycosyltransferase [Bacteroidetes bacterium]|jgi:glycosyltransferase involved in cell wall biosynthesis|nr:glycosyltransferase [Bacteroidota bacterium]